MCVCVCECVCVCVCCISVWGVCCVYISLCEGCVRNSDKLLRNLTEYYTCSSSDTIFSDLKYVYCI